MFAAFSSPPAPRCECCRSSPAWYRSCWVLLLPRLDYESILLLALWIGIGWLFRGVDPLAAALSFDHIPGRGWQVLSGVIIVIGGGVLIISPLDSIAILTLVAGSWLIGDRASSDVISAFRSRHRLKA